MDSALLILANLLVWVWLFDITINTIYLIVIFGTVMTYLFVLFTKKRNNMRMENNIQQEHSLTTVLIYIYIYIELGERIPIHGEI